MREAIKTKFLLRFFAQEAYERWAQVPGTLELVVLDFGTWTTGPRTSRLNSCRRS